MLVCRTSTNWASPRDSVLCSSACSNVGPAGSRPGEKEGFAFFYCVTTKKIWRDLDVLEESDHFYRSIY